MKRLSLSILVVVPMLVVMLAPVGQKSAVRAESAKFYLDRGMAYLNKGQLDQAIADFNKVLEINPRLADAYNNRGEAYNKKGQYDKAIADYKRALEINPKYPTAWFNKGQACEKAGRKAEAREAYQKFIRYAPLQQAAKIQHAQARIRALSSQAETPQATTSTPGVGAKKWGNWEKLNWMLHNNKGANLMLAGQYRKALFHLNKAIEIAPSVSLSYKNRAKVYFKLKQYNKAWDDVKKAQSLKDPIGLILSDRSDMEGIVVEWHPGKSQGLKDGKVDPEFLQELRRASGREN